jgi:putative flippase GtrA
VTFVERVLGSRFLRFALVGGAGFVVNEVALAIALRLAHLDKYSGWLAAFLVAVTFTWWGNRTLTFRDFAARKGLIGEWAAFLLANSLGAAANFAVYSALVTFAARPFGDPFVAVAAGTLVGLVFNFAASQRFVFRDQSPKSR